MSPTIESSWATAIRKVSVMSFAIGAGLARGRGCGNRAGTARRELGRAQEPPLSGDVERARRRGRVPALKRVAHRRAKTGSFQEREVMVLFSKDIRTMDDLFVHQLRDIYYAEKQIVKALPKMINKASDSDVKTALLNHFYQSKNHVGRVERVFEMYDREPRTVDCPAIDGIIKEANEVIGDVEDKDVLDAAIIAAAQAVKHYEIARYGTLIAWA